MKQVTLWIKSPTGSSIYPLPVGSYWNTQQFGFLPELEHPLPKDVLADTDDLPKGVLCRCKGPDIPQNRHWHGQWTHSSIYTTLGVCIGAHARICSVSEHGLCDCKIWRADPCRHGHMTKSKSCIPLESNAPLRHALHSINALAILQYMSWVHFCKSHASSLTCHVNTAQAWIDWSHTNGKATTCTMLNTHIRQRY